MGKSLRHSECIRIVKSLTEGWVNTDNRIRNTTYENTNEELVLLSLNGQNKQKSLLVESQIN